jgi:hypothetical protein
VKALIDFDDAPVFVIHMIGRFGDVSARERHA